MLEKIYNFIIENNLVAPQDIVICGLSGGADSVSLLLSLFQLKDRLNISIEALHVNHCLRGKESDRDEQFCRELCKRLEIPFWAVSCDVRGYALKNSLSCEEAARKLRYGIFDEYSHGKKIATAHNANDNLETVILNLARGTALKGLSGIPVKRNNIIRPLLSVTRTDIEAFLVSENQSFVTDSTNLSDDFTRNKIRHNIVPQLQQLNSSVIETSIRSISALRSENELLDSQTDAAMEECRIADGFSGLSVFHSVIRRRCIARLLTEKNLPYSSDRLAQADRILMNGGKINVSGDIYLVSDKNSIVLISIPQKKEQELISKDMVIGENHIFPNKTLLCEIVECDNLKKIRSVNNLLTFYLADYDKIKGRIIVRSRKFGDKIQLCGRNFNSSVKKLINQTVPLENRNFLHFLEDEDGTVFAENIGIAQRVAPDKNTVRLLKISVIDSIDKL